MLKTIDPLFPLLSCEPCRILPRHLWTAVFFLASGKSATGLFLLSPLTSGGEGHQGSGWVPAKDPLLVQSICLPGHYLVCWCRFWLWARSPSPGPHWNSKFLHAGEMALCLWHCRHLLKFTDGLTKDRELPG